MNKRKKILIGAIVAAVVVIAVIICLIFVFRKSDDEEEFTGIMDGIGEIEYMEYTYNSKTYVLTKKSGTWLWEYNPTLLVDQEAINSQMKTLDQFVTVDKYKRTEKLDEYGLEDPYCKVTFKDSTGKTIDIYIGDNLMDESCYYAMTKENKYVYVITSDIIELIEDLEAEREYREIIDTLSTPTERGY